MNVFDMFAVVYASAVVTTFVFCVFVNMWRGDGVGGGGVGFFFQAEDGIRDLVRSRGLGDVYKRQAQDCQGSPASRFPILGATPAIAST